MRGLVRASVVARRDHDELADGEREMIDRFLFEYDRLDDPFANDLVHVTGSAIVVGPRGVLLLRHKRLGMWLQPGGHIDPGEVPWAAALREAMEETGLDLELVPNDDQSEDSNACVDTPRLIHVDVHAGGRGHTHLDLRYFVRPVAGSDDTPNPPTDESQDVEWFNVAAAAERASDERLAALLRKL